MLVARLGQFFTKINQDGSAYVAVQHWDDPNASPGRGLDKFQHFKLKCLHAKYHECTTKTNGLPSEFDDAAAANTGKSLLAAYDRGLTS